MLANWYAPALAQPRARTVLDSTLPTPVLFPPNPNDLEGVAQAVLAPPSSS